MDFSQQSTDINWRLRLRSSPNEVYRMLSTDEGRALFWAESAIETDRAIDFIFPNGMRWRGRIVEDIPPKRYVVEYIGGSITSFDNSSPPKHTVGENKIYRSEDTRLDSSHL